jgi:glycosyltransferase involved in cell wall biosynthesis
MPAVYSAIDALALPSLYGEGLSNALIEAMACERPCVVTDIGDSALVVGDLGIVVPPGDEHPLADALLRLFAESEQERRQRGRMARQRIQSHFTDDRQAEELERVFAHLLAPR